MTVPVDVASNIRRWLLGLSSQSQGSSTDSTPEIIDDEAYLDAVKNLHKGTQNLSAMLVSEVENNLFGIVDEFITELQRSKALRTHPNIPIPGYQRARPTRSTNSKTLPDKEFLLRSSVLTELFKIPHIKTLYNIFVAVLVILFLNTAMSDLFTTGSLKLHLELIEWSFSQLHTVMAIWAIMFGSTILILYPGFQCWANKRWMQADKKLWDLSWLSLYLGYVFCMIYFPINQAVKHHFPPACSMIVLSEQVRFIMKVHAFIRSNAPVALRFSPPEDYDTSEFNDGGPCPDFKKFLYFHFAPTLIYRDNYPRTPRVRWSYVVSNLAQMVACILYVHYVFVRFLVPVFQRFGQQPITVQNIILTVFASMLPGTLILLVSFFAILHIWHNAFAEMLQFGDRMFYKDWWNSTSYSKYYRTWNVIIHDWLYIYIYKDCYELTLSWKNGRHLSRFLVISVSAFVHEYIVSLTFGFFYPVLFIMFAFFGVMFLFLPDNQYINVWNIYLWVTLFTGNGLMMSLYSMEWYARVNCPPYSDSFSDYLIPRTWTCFPPNNTLPELNHC